MIKKWPLLISLQNFVNKVLLQIDVVNFSFDFHDSKNLKMRSFMWRKLESRGYPKEKDENQISAKKTEWKFSIPNLSEELYIDPKNKLQNFRDH